MSDTKATAEAKNGVCVCVMRVFILGLPFALTHACPFTLIFQNPWT